jgi:hypothetical protein
LAPSEKPGHAVQQVEHPLRVNLLLLFSGYKEKLGVRIKVIQKLETKPPELWLKLYTVKRIDRGKDSG